MTLTLKQQHDLRNGIECLKGFLMKLYKESQISYTDCLTGLVYLKRMDRCLNDGSNLWQCISNCCAKLRWKRKKVGT